MVAKIGLCQVQSMPLSDIYHQNHHMKDENSSTEIFLQSCHIHAQQDAKEMINIEICDGV